MKRNLLIIIGVVVLAAAAFFYWHQHSLAAIGSLNIYSGDVDVVSGQNSQPGKTGLGIQAGDVLKVHSGSRVSIILKDGSVVRLEAGSEVAVAKLAYSGNKIKDAELDVKTGRIWSHDQAPGVGGDYKVETPTIVAAVRGTSFNLDYLGATSTVYVYTHSVNVNLKSNPNSGKEVIAGDIFSISDSNAQSDFDAGPGQAGPEFVDDWVSFNQQQDNALDGANPSPSPSPAATSTPPTSATSTPATGTPPALAKPSLSPNPNPAPAPLPLPALQTPAGPSLTALTLTAVSSQVTAGQATLLKVTAKYSDGSSASVGSQVSWQQTPEIGTIKSPGYFSGVLSGTTKITASLGNVFSNPVSVTVVDQQSRPAVSLSRISVVCQKIYSASLTSTSLPHAQCGASGYYSDGSSASITAQVAWSAAGTAGGGIDASGYYTPETQGSVTISASHSNLSGNASLSIP